MRFSVGQGRTGAYWRSNGGTKCATHYAGSGATTTARTSPSYAVMLAVILVLVLGTVRLVGSNANNVFSSAASSLQ